MSKEAIARGRGPASLSCFDTSARTAYTASILRIMKHAFERLTEHGRNAKRNFERRRILALLDRVHRLPRDADLVGELLLRHLAILKTQPSDFVADRGHVRPRADAG